MKTASLLFGAVAICLAAASPVTAGDQAAAEIKLFQFKPKTLEIRAGTTVTWTNGDAIEHSVTAGKPGKAGGAFDSEFFTRGQSWSHTFTEPGTYTYFCKRHNSMTATVTVMP
jgi:plastocyanin